MILIVDDERELGALLEKVFRYFGHEAVSVRTGMEAISMIHLRKPDLIVTDLQMPVMDGLTLLRAIRADATCNDVPVMVYTVDFAAEVEREAYAAGAQDFVVKGTIGWDALMQRVGKLLKQSGHQS